MEVVETAIPEVRISTRKKCGDHLPCAASGYSRLSQAATGCPRPSRASRYSTSSQIR